jgi:hypothetical protein
MMLGMCGFERWGDVWDGRRIVERGGKIGDWCRIG